MGARDKINAISLNVKINKRQSVHIRGYKLPIHVENFTQKGSAQAKISLKVVGGLLFLTHPICVVQLVKSLIYCPCQLMLKSYLFTTDSS